MCLPERNNFYGSKDYWEKRFEDEEAHEWLVSYSQIKNLIKKYAAFDDLILVLGCGTSLLGHEMLLDGFKSVHSIDYCENVVSKMSDHCLGCKSMDWAVADATILPFRDQTFDLVIEKATIDTFLVGEKSLWNPGQTSLQKISLVLKEVERILTNSGIFLSITFNEPIFRAPMYSCFQFDWGIDSIEKIGTDFHHYLYALQKGLKQNKISVPRYEPPKVIETSDTDDESHEENDIFQIIV